MQIPFHRPDITDDDIRGVAETLRSGWITMGEKTFEFERRFAEITGARHAVAVNSCTAALHLALVAAGVGRGDEVIVPVWTFAATAEAVWYCGAVPVLADVERDTLLIDLSDVQKRISEKTKAIIPVHYAGQPAAIDEIREIAQAGKIAVIDDAAHSFPAWYGGKMIGGISDMTCFSFYATKTITTGEGGMITTNRDDYATTLKTLRLHGISHDAWNRYSDRGSWMYDVTEIGFKYNMSDISAALGITQLARYKDMWMKRKRIAGVYSEAFDGIPQISSCPVREGRESAWYLYPIILDVERLAIPRDDFIRELRERGITCSVHFIPLHRFSYYKKAGYRAEQYPNAEWAFPRTLSLPIFPGMTDEEVRYVADNVIEVIAAHAK